MYDNDLDTECNVCKFKREISHVHQGVLVPGTPATCTQEGSKAYYTCTCQQNFEDEACTILIADLGSWRVIPATGHIWSDTYLAANADAEKHYHVCTVCNAKDEGEAHTWNANAATETHDKHCIICGYVAEAPHRAYPCGHIGSRPGADLHPGGQQSLLHLYLPAKL